MASTSQPRKGCEGVLPTLSVSIEALDIAKDTWGFPPAQVALGSAIVPLTMIRVSFPLFCEDEFRLTPIQDTMSNSEDCNELGQTCGDVYQKLYRRLKGRQLDRLNQSVLDAMGDLTWLVSHTIDVHVTQFAHRCLNRRTLAGIERRVAKQGKRTAVLRFILDNKDKIAAWRQDLVSVLQVFKVRSISSWNSRT
jgi:hypothetical protein